MTGETRVLVVDDEPAIQRAIRTFLGRSGFRVEVASDGKAALAALGSFRPDVILLDLGLPDMTGFDVIRTVRERAATPIVVLSVHDAERDKVTALDLGADDYLTKPFGVDELSARIRVALRHSSAATSDGVFEAGDLRVDLVARRVTARGQDVKLTPTEYDLLKALAGAPGRVLTDAMLLRQVWGPGYGAEAHYLHVYVARLRKKIEADPQHPRHIITEPGVGYRLLGG